MILSGVSPQYLITGPHAIRCEFLTNHTTSHHQLYAGRRLIGETVRRTDRFIDAQFTATTWPQVLTLVAVTDVERGNDHGDDLPPRAFNVGKITVDTTGWPVDAKLIEVTAGTVAGGAVSSTNVIAKTVHQANGTHILFTKPFTGSGSWNIEIYGRDNKLPSGNVGTSATASLDILATPPDFNEEFGVNIDSGTATFTATLPV